MYRDRERCEPTPSITERIRSAGVELGVSRAEIEREMARFYNERDIDGIVGMFDAYYDWENRQSHTSPKQRNPSEVRDLALRNFDYVASVAEITEELQPVMKLQQ